MSVLCYSYPYRARRLAANRDEGHGIRVRGQGPAWIRAFLNAWVRGDPCPGADVFKLEITHCCTHEIDIDMYNKYITYMALVQRAMYSRPSNP
jgi:hypothetical protein